jgi:hypothetical protein
MNSAENELLNKIIAAVSNPEHIGVDDKRRVACIFYKLFKQKGPIYADTFDTPLILDALPSNYSESTKETILNIIEVTAMLPYC